MNWQMDFGGSFFAIPDHRALTFFFILAIIGFIWLVFFLAELIRYFWFFSKRPTDRYGDYPPKLHIRSEDNISMILKRRWLRGRWRYVVEGEIAWNYESFKFLEEQLEKTIFARLRKNLRSFFKRE